LFAAKVLYKDLAATDELDMSLLLPENQGPRNQRVWAIYDTNYYAYTVFVLEIEMSR
jgi:hypothetical protein